MRTEAANDDPVTGFPRSARGRACEAVARRCALTRESHPKSEMIRFVIGPDDRVVPDVAGDLPGRGIWLCARRDVVNTACAKGCFARAAGRRAVASTNLADEVERLLARRCLNFLGLARRAGEALGGYEKVRAMLVRGEAAALLGAADGAPEGRAKLRALAGGARVFELFTNAELAAALGRENVVHAAIGKGRLACRFALDASRLAGFRTVGAGAP